LRAHRRHSNDQREDGSNLRLTPRIVAREPKGEIMGVISWIILGLIAGFVGSKIVNKTGEGLVLDIVLGIVGALVGGFLFSLAGIGGVTGLDIRSVIIAIIGWSSPAPDVGLSISGAPTRRRFIVGELRLDPSAERPVGKMGALPERRLGFKIVHQESGGRESFAAMGRGGGDKNDATARFNEPVTVDDPEGEERPTGKRFRRDPLDLLFRHGAIVLDLQSGERAAFVATETDETCERADIRAAAAEGLGFGCSVEILPLNAD
jgi:uncharacterized membrane protein YeaQ/YmgE (transglycosylase-associated protein family)